MSQDSTSGESRYKELRSRELVVGKKIGFSKIMIKQAQRNYAKNATPSAESRMSLEMLRQTQANLHYWRTQLGLVQGEIAKLQLGHTKAKLREAESKLKQIVNLPHEDFCCTLGCAGHGMALCGETNDRGRECTGARCTCSLRMPLIIIQGFDVVPRRPIGLMDLVVSQGILRARW